MNESAEGKVTSENKITKGEIIHIAWDLLDNDTNRYELERIIAPTEAYANWIVMFACLDKAEEDFLYSFAGGHPPNVLVNAETGKAEIMLWM